jgi:hypothetical protein
VVTLQSDIAYANLTAQLDTLASDLSSVGSLENAATDDLLLVAADAAAALASAKVLLTLHGIILTAMVQPGIFAAGSSAQSTITNLQLLLISSTNVALNEDTINRLTRLQRNVLTVGS